jgi:hypothetical protein
VIDGKTYVDIAGCVCVGVKVGYVCLGELCVWRGGKV